MPTRRTREMTLIKSESSSRGNRRDFNKQFEFYCLTKLIEGSNITITALFRLQHAATQSGEFCTPFCSLASSYKFVIAVVFKASVFFVLLLSVYLHSKKKKTNAIPRVPLWEMTDLPYIRLFCDKRVIESHSVQEQTCFFFVFLNK